MDKHIILEHQMVITLKTQLNDQIQGKFKKEKFYTLENDMVQVNWHQRISLLIEGLAEKSIYDS